MNKERTKNGGRILRCCAASVLAAVMGISAIPTSYAAGKASPLDGVGTHSESTLSSITEAESRTSAHGSRYVGDHGTLSYNLPGMPSLNIWAHKQMVATVGGRRLSEPALFMNGVTYLPLRATVNNLPGVTMTYSAQTKTATLRAAGLELTATHGGYVTYANGRALFAFSPVAVMSNGKMYLPAVSLAKAFGMELVRDGTAVTLNGSLRPLASAAEYYREDEVFWLGRIIQAESGGEPLLGQMAVGNVILNRVRSSAYPNTIYGVIFDRRYGVQFSPILNGSIYNTPSYTARLAAMICLEGTLLSEEVLFFLNPVESQSSWIVKNRKYAYTILNHDFYY